MAGNVWEWCLNEYDNPRSRAANKIDRSDVRVIRGGSYYYDREDLPSSCRRRFTAGDADVSIGFRLAQASN